MGTWLGSSLLSPVALASRSFASRWCGFACAVSQKCARPAIWCRNPGYALLSSPKDPSKSPVALPSLPGRRAHQRYATCPIFLLSWKASDHKLVLCESRSSPKTWYIYDASNSNFGIRHAFGRIFGGWYVEPCCCDPSAG